MSGFKIYAVSTGMVSDRHFAKLSDAVAEAKAQIRDFGLEEIEIELHRSVPITAGNLIDILNSSGGSWSASHEVAKIIRAKKARKQ